MKTKLKIKGWMVEISGEIFNLENFRKTDGGAKFIIRRQVPFQACDLIGKSFCYKDFKNPFVIFKMMPKRKYAGLQRIFCESKYQI